MPSAYPPPESLRLSRILLTELAAAIGLIALPLFAAQPLVGLIGPSLGLPPALAGLAPTLTLVGYAAGLVALVPLTDMLEKRRLVLWTLAAEILALVAAAAAPTAAFFLTAAFAIGVATSAIQMLVPMVAAISPEAERGRAIGTAMSGLMVGILLSRPSASLVADHFGWRMVYAIDAVAILAVMLLLAKVLPRHRAAVSVRYRALVTSLWTLVRDEPVLRRRAAYQALCMAAFGAFWTSVGLCLTAEPFRLSQTGIALFALAGAGGAIISPLAGRAADRGLANIGTRVAHGTALVALLIAGLAGAGWFRFEPAAYPNTALALMALAAFVLDLGVIGDQTIGRRAINMLRPEARGRMNGLFTGLFFVGSAGGSALSGVAWALSGWPGVCFVGLLCAAAALNMSLREQDASADEASRIAQTSS